MELSPVSQVPWICDLPFLSSPTAIDALNCCIEFCSSTKLWVTRPPITPRASVYLLCLLQTRIMATGAVAILCFRCKQFAALLEADCSSSPALTPDIKWFFRQTA